MFGIAREMGPTSPRSDGAAVDIPEETRRKWQRSVDLLAQLLDAPSIVVIRIRPPEARVFAASRTAAQMLVPGEALCTVLKSFCDDVLKRGGETGIADARQNARAAEEGAVPCIGLPLYWPNHDAFGVLGVLDHQPREFSETHRELLRQYREAFEQDLDRLIDRTPVDTTARRHQKDLRLITAILDTADLLVVVMDAQARIVRFNHACERHTGYAAHEVQGKRVWEVLLAPEDVDPVRQVLDELQAGSFPNYYENDWVGKDGSRRLIAWTNTAIVGEHGELEFVLGTGIDLTERKRAEEERSRLERLLLQAQKMEALGQLAGGVAHGFHNWLTVILCAAEKLRMVMGEDASTHEIVRAIEHAGHQAAGVTRSLLSFSRDIPVGREPLCLGSAVEEWTGILRRALPAPIELITEPQPEPPLWIRGDSTQLQQVLLNLVLNARDAMPDGGTLRIGVRRARQEDLRECVESTPYQAAGEYACVVVVDSGVGIAPERQRCVFEPFFTTKNRDRGSGLGLAIVYNVVKQHRGFVGLSSDVGKGTTFKILLPLMAEETPGTHELVRTSIARGHDETILLAMRDPHSRGLTAFSLGAMGYQIICVADPGAAMSQALTQAPRAIIIDANLMAGDMMEWMRQILDLCPATPVVVVATDRSAANIPDLPNSRIAVLEKPFQTAQLGKTLGDLLQADSRR